MMRAMMQVVLFVLLNVQAVAAFENTIEWGDWDLSRGLYSFGDGHIPSRDYTPSVVYQSGMVMPVDPDLMLSRAAQKIYYGWRGKSYFPESGLGNGDKDGPYSTSRSVSYSLSGLAEPIIKDAVLTGEDAIVRFTLSSSFYGHYVFRAVARGEARILSITLSYSSEWGPIEVHSKQQVSLTHGEFERIQVLALAANAVGPAPKDRFVADGADWVSEMVDAQGYSVSFYHSPGFGPWRDLARMMFGFVDEEHRTGFLERYTPVAPTAQELRAQKEEMRLLNIELGLKPCDDPDRGSVCFNGFTQPDKAPDSP